MFSDSDHQDQTTPRSRNVESTREGGGGKEVEVEYPHQRVMREFKATAPKLLRLTGELYDGCTGNTQWSPEGLASIDDVKAQLVDTMAMLDLLLTKKRCLPRRGVLPPP